MKTINSLADAVFLNANQKGFHTAEPNDDKFLPTAIANLHAEVSELWEAHRAGTLFQPCDKADKMVAMGLEPLTCIEEELADIIIRALDNSRRFKVDIQRAIEIKHAYNQSRPHMHGKKA